MKKYIIFGAVNAKNSNSEKLYEWVKVKGYHFAYYIDNDLDKIGKYMNDYPIFPPSKIEEENLSEIFILVGGGDNAQQQIGIQLLEMKLENRKNFELANEVFVPLINEEPNKKFKEIFFEISEMCNARCPYCVTGSQNSSKANIFDKKIELKKFKSILEHLEKHKIIEERCNIALFNWGEPFLNKQLPQIIDLITEKNYTISLSTNCSTNVDLINKVNTLRNVEHIIVSMPGFSQESYDKIHGFKFDKIIINLRKLVRYVREKEFQGVIGISFHVYKFNYQELKQANDFCEQMNIKFMPYYAYLNGEKLLTEFLNNNLEYEFLEKINKDIEVRNIENMRKLRPSNYKCPGENIFAIDTQGNVRICCSTDYCNEMNILGSIFELSLEQIINKKKDHEICIGCKKQGRDYIGYNTVAPNAEYFK